MNLLGTIFRHHEADVWRTLSEGIGGELLQDGWRNDKVVCEVEGRQVILDLCTECGYKSEAIYTRFRAQIRNPTKLEFKARPAFLLDRIAELFGVRDVRIGKQVFDRNFRITASDGPRAKQIFATPSIVARMMAEPDVNIHLLHAPSHERPTTNWELVVMVEEEINDVERLEELFFLFSDLLREVHAVV